MMRLFSEVCPMPPRQEQEGQPAARVLRGELSLAWIPSLNLMPVRLLVVTFNSLWYEVLDVEGGDVLGLLDSCEGPGLACKMQNARAEQATERVRHQPSFGTVGTCRL